MSHTETLPFVVACQETSRGFIVSRIKIAAICACLCWSGIFSANADAALEVEEVRWGFDGQVVQHRFNLLSVLVSNPTGEPFDGGMALTREISEAAMWGPCCDNRYFSPDSQKNGCSFIPL